MFTSASGGPKAVSYKDSPNLEIVDIEMPYVAKQNFIKRWFQESKYGIMTIKEIKMFSPDIVVSANTCLTLGDRVHACVITLAYGNPAMLFTPSPRSRLFDRVGLNDIRTKPVTLDLDYLEVERTKEIEFLKNTIASLV